MLFILMTLCCFLMFVLLVDLCWPEGREVLRGTLFPIGAAQKQALEVFAWELHQGLPLQEAIANLYGTVIWENGTASLR